MGLGSVEPPRDLLPGDHTDLLREEFEHRDVGIPRVVQPGAEREFGGLDGRPEHAGFPAVEGLKRLTDFRSLFHLWSPFTEAAPGNKARAA